MKNRDQYFKNQEKLLTLRKLLNSSPQLEDTTKIIMEIERISKNNDSLELKINNKLSESIDTDNDPVLVKARAMRDKFQRDKKEKEERRRLYTLSSNQVKEFENALDDLDRSFLALRQDLKEAIENKRNIEIDMEQDLADTNDQELIDAYGDALNKVDIDIDEIKQQLSKIENRKDFIIDALNKHYDLKESLEEGIKPIKNKKYDIGDEITLYNGNWYFVEEILPNGDLLCIDQDGEVLQVSDDEIMDNNRDSRIEKRMWEAKSFMPTLSNFLNEGLFSDGLDIDTVKQYLINAGFELDFVSNQYDEIHEFYVGDDFETLLSNIIAIDGEIDGKDKIVGPNYVIKIISHFQILLMYENTNPKQLSKKEDEF